MTITPSNILKVWSSVSRFSSATAGNITRVQVDPSQFVAGVTNVDLDTNPLYKSYFEANFSPFRKPKPENDEETEDNQNTSASQVNEKENKLIPMTSSLDNIRQLWCYRRREEGTRSCNTLRGDRRLIPGIIYGSDPTKNIKSLDAASKILVKTPWNQVQKEFDRFTYHRFECKVYDLTVYENKDDTMGTVHRVTPRNVQHHPIKNNVYCVNYLRYFPGKPISLPIVYINEEESAVLKRGGFIAPVSRYVSCVIDSGVPIPTHLELECTGLKLKDVVRLDRIIFPQGVHASKHVNPKTFLVGTVFGRRSDTVDEKPEKEKSKSEKK